MIVQSVVTAKTSKDLSYLAAFPQDQEPEIHEASTSMASMEPPSKRFSLTITGKIDDTNFHDQDEQQLVKIATQMRYKGLSEVEFTYLLNEFLQWFYTSPDRRRVFKEFLDHKGQYYTVIPDLIIGMAKFKSNFFSAKEKRAFLIELLSNKSPQVRFGSIYGLSYLAARDDLKKLKEIAKNETNPIVKSLIKSQIRKLE